MSNLHKHNPLLRNNLIKYVNTGNANGLKNYIQSLSVSEFRTTSYMLAEEVLIKATNDDFWTFFITIVPINAKAFLGTFLKAAVTMYENGTLSLKVDVVKRFAQACSSIDRKKVMEALLPCMRTPNEVQMLIDCMSINDDKCWAYPYLLKSQTLPCFYVLFILLKADDVMHTRSCITYLIRVGTSLSFNMANVLKCYFDIDNVPVTFSLNIEDYKLSRLDQGYEQFKKILNN